MIIYTDMVADLFHAGHIIFFSKILDKYPGSKLYVGLMSDIEAKYYKRLPILNIEERYIAVANCKYVSYVFKNPPMPITKGFIEKYKIDKVIHADDIAQESKNYWYKIPLQLKIYDEISYTNSISTTNIINRILETDNYPIIDTNLILKFIVVYIIIIFLFSKKNIHEKWCKIQHINVQNYEVIVNKNKLNKLINYVKVKNTEFTNYKLKTKNDIINNLSRINLLTSEYENSKTEYEKKLNTAYQDINLKKKKIILLDNKLKYTTNNCYKNDNNLKTIILKKDKSSTTILTVSKYVSTKYDNNTTNINVYENEKKWLNILKNTNIIAKPINFNDELRIITTEYSGEKINKFNLPNNWTDQRDNIISVLKKHNCRHNDIKPDEILVHDGIIKIIDFGWANELDRENPKNWPVCLGDKFKSNKENLEFDDETSFNKSISYILNNNLD